MKEKRHSGKDTSVTSNQITTTGRLAPVLIGSGKGSNPNSKKNLKSPKRKVNAEIPHFFGGVDLFDGPWGPPAYDEEDDD